MFKQIMKYGKAENTFYAKTHLSQNPKLLDLFWEATLKCNARCKHCGSRIGEHPDLSDELTTEEIKKAFADIAKKYDASKILINVTGGEPIVRKDLFQVMEFAHTLGYHWGMTTNGILMDDIVIEKMKKSGMVTISISVDGLENSHDELRQQKGSYLKIIENIKKVKAANFLDYLQITTVVNKINIHELDAMYQEFQKLGVDSWRLLSIEPIGRVHDNKSLLLDADDYKKLLSFIKEKRKKTKFDITYGCSHFTGFEYESDIRKTPFSCWAGILIGSILYNGDIYVCPSVPRIPSLIQGNIRNDDFVEIWENKFEWFRNMDKFHCKTCAGCENWKYCLGGSAHTWDFEKQEPQICLSKILKTKNI